MNIRIEQSNPNWLEKLKKRFGNGSYEIAVGLPKGENTSGILYPNGVALLDVAFYNEYGTVHIPARPAIKLGGRHANQALGELLKSVIRNTNDDKILIEELKKVGQQATSIVKKEITDLRKPPNAPSTIRKKGSDNPLIDTGTYRQSITYQIRRKK